jgi:hypothetical protein
VAVISLRGEFFCGIFPSLEEADVDFRHFRVYVDEMEGKGFDTNTAFPVLAIRDGQGGATELLVPNIKKKLTWVKMKNTTFMGLSKV